jgi:hypothetical protein
MRASGALRRRIHGCKVPVRGYAWEARSECHEVCRRPAIQADCVSLDDRRQSGWIVGLRKPWWRTSAAYMRRTLVTNWFLTIGFSSLLSSPSRWDIPYCVYISIIIIIIIIVVRSSWRGAACRCIRLCVTTLWSLAPFNLSQFLVSFVCSSNMHRTRATGTIVAETFQILTLQDCREAFPTTSVPCGHCAGQLVRGSLWYVCITGACASSISQLLKTQNQIAEWYSPFLWSVLNVLLCRSAHL